MFLSLVDGMMDTLKVILARSFLFIILITYLGCEKEIQLDIGEFQPKIVVNALLQEGENWEIHVCQSKNVLEPNKEVNLPGARVTVQNINSGNIFQLQYDKEGIFINDTYTINHATDYKITVSHPGFESISARAYVPQPIDVKVLHSETLDFNGKVALKVDFEITDDPTSDNYYIYEILNLFPHSPIDPSTIPFLESPIKSWLSSVDGNTGYIDNGTEKQSKLFITDQNFRGSVLNTSLVSFVEVQEGKGKDNQGTDSEYQYSPDFAQSRLKVVGASKEMYEYYKSIELMIQREALNSSASTPVKPFTNIENGLGIFAGFTEIVINVQQ